MVFFYEGEKTVISSRQLFKMKRQYWFIIVFVIWCVASAWWYLFGVKGVKTDLQFFNPQATLISIIEILAMLLVACLIGFTIAWHMRTETLEEQHENTETLLSDNSSLLRTSNDLKAQYELMRNKYQQDVRASRHRLDEIGQERDQLQEELDALKTSTSLQPQNNASQVQLEHLENEAGTLRYKIRQLEFQIKEYETANAKLKHEVEILHARKEKLSGSDHPFVRPVEPDEKDDLTSIKGIGPFIEKRLNMLGIYTFKQLSELTPELIDRVGNAIEFFPGRIERENWIGQARDFSSQRN